MNKIKKLSILALILLLVGTVGSIITYKQSYSQELDVTKIDITDYNFTSIEISVLDANAELLPSSDSTAYMEVAGSDFNKKLAFTVQDSLLYIKYNNKQVKFFNLGFSKKESLKVYLPDKQYEQIVIKKNDSVFKAKNMAAKQFTISGKDGIVSLENISAADISITARDSMLELNELKGALQAKVKDGKINLVAEQLNYPVDIAANDGLITVVTQKEPENTIIQTEVRDGLTSIYGKRTSSALFGNGENKVQLSVKDGMINVKKQGD